MTPSGIYNHSHIIPWNKGLKGAVIVSEETRAKLRAKRAGRRPGLGKKRTPESIRRMSESQKAIDNKPPSALGRKHTPESLKRMSAAQKLRCENEDRRGAKSPHWKGGIANRNHVARTSKAFIEWRCLVFTRDNWTCQDCGQHGVHLHPHHIKEFAKYPELRFDVDNGLTLCRPCHLRLHGLLPKSAQTPAT